LLNWQLDYIGNCGLEQPTEKLGIILGPKYLSVPGTMYP